MKKANSPRSEQAKVRIETAVTASFSMDYFRFGQGKEALVILPGISIRSVMTAADEVAKAYRTLADDFTVYVFDRRKELPPAYSIEEMANDTADALRTIGLDRVNLFGVSQGGMIAMKLAIAFPKLIDRLILGSTAARSTESARKAVEQWIGLAKEQNAEALFLAFGEAIYPEAVFENAKPLLRDAAKSATKADLDRFVILAQSLKAFDVSDELKKLFCPTLVVGDRKDRLLGAEASEILAKALPKSSLYYYDGYGHAAYDLAPDYKERILLFLRSTKDQSAENPFGRGNI